MRKIRTTAALAGTIMLSMALAAPPALGETPPSGDNPTQQEWQQLEDELSKLLPKPNSAFAFTTSRSERISMEGAGTVASFGELQRGWQAKGGSWAVYSTTTLDNGEMYSQEDDGTVRVTAGVRTCTSSCGTAKKPTGWAMVHPPEESVVPDARRHVQLPRDASYLQSAYALRVLPVHAALDIVGAAKRSSDSTLIETAMADGSTQYAGSYLDAVRNTPVLFNFTVTKGAVTQTTMSANADSGAFYEPVYKVAYKFSSKLVDKSTRIPATPDSRRLVQPSTLLQGELKVSTKDFGMRTATELNRMARKLKVTPDQAWVLSHIDEAAGAAGRRTPVRLVQFRVGAHPLVNAGESKVLLEYIGTNIPAVPGTANRAMSMTLVVRDGKVIATMLQNDDTFSKAEAKLRTIMNTEETK